MIKTGDKMTLKTLKGYLNAMSLDNRTVEVKVENKFMDISDISVDLDGNVVLYTKDKVIPPCDPYRNFRA